MTLHVGVTGSSGLIGSALSEHLERSGHRVTRLVRPTPRAACAASPAWDPASSWIEEGALDGCDAIVHLAGASIGEGRWTAGRKRELRASRTAATRLLVEHLAGLRRPPRVLVCASGIGYYGDRGDELLDESCGRGSGFLAELVEAWEAEARAAEWYSVRVVTARFGVVLARHGGALPRMMLPIRLGAGGPLAGGRQWMPWVTLDDAVRALTFLLTHEVHGVCNVTAPEPARNRDFVGALARQLQRPAFIPTPAFALRLAVGQAADELLLASTRATPRRLLEAGFAFEHATLEHALPAVLAQEPLRATVG